MHVIRDAEIVEDLYGHYDYPKIYIENCSGKLILSKFSVDCVDSKFSDIIFKDCFDITFSEITCDTLTIQDCSRVELNNCIIKSLIIEGSPCHASFSNCTITNSTIDAVDRFTIIDSSILRKLFPEENVIDEEFNFDYFDGQIILRKIPLLNPWLIPMVNELIVQDLDNVPEEILKQITRLTIAEFHEKISLCTKLKQLIFTLQQFTIDIFAKMTIPKVTFPEVVDYTYVRVGNTVYENRWIHCNDKTSTFTFTKKIE